MSEVKFSAELDTQKLDAAIKQSNKTISDWAKGVEKAGAQSDQGFNKVTKSLKDAIKEQKDLIKNIESDVKRLQKAYDDAAAGKAKQSAGNELRSAKRALAEEQATLLGLQKQQIEANEEENSSVFKLVGSLGKWVAGLFTVGAALKVAKGIIASTEETSHKFEVVIAQASAGVGYFYKTIASGDWSNFFGNLEKAISGAKEYVDTMEKLANKQNEQKIKSSDLDREIAELRDATYDKDESNNEARRDALTKIIAKQEEKYKDEAALAKEAYNANLKKAASDSGLSEKQIENFIKEYSSFEKLIEIGERYNELQKLMYSPGMSNKFLDDLQKQVKLLGPGAEEAGKYVKQISKVTPETRKQLSEFAAQANEAEAAFGQRNRRDKAQLAEVENNIKKQQEENRKKSQEDAKLDNQLAKQQELLKEAAEKGDTVALKAIADRIVLLEKELAIRNEIAKTSLLEAYGGAVKTINPKSLNLPTFFTGKRIQDNGLIGPDQKQAKLLLDQIKERGRQRQWNEDDAKNDERKKQNQKEILKGATDLTYQLGVQLGLSKEQLDTLGAELDAFTQIASGNYIGAAVSLLSQLMSSFPDQTEKFANEVERLNKAIEEQQRIIDRSERFGGTTEALQRKIDLLEQQANATIKEAMILAGKGQGSAATELIEQYKEIKAAIEDTNQEIEDFWSGGITQQTIADAITGGLQEGRNSFRDFAEDINKILLDAIMKSLNARILGPQLTALTDYISEAMKSEGKLDSVEVKKIKEWYASIAEGAKDVYDSMTGALDITGPKTGLTGQIQRSITEETGTEWVGITRRQADDIRVVKDYTLMGVNHLVGIEANTFNTVLELQKAVIELQAINSNTKQVPAAAI